MGNGVEKAGRSEPRMAAQVPQSFRNGSHLPNKSLHLYQVELYFRLVLSMCSIIGILLFEVLQIFAVGSTREA